MRSKGYRRDTRGKFKKDFKQAKIPLTSTILNQYKRGDYVDIAVDSSIHKGMPHSKYVGHTGRVYTVFKNSVGVALTRVFEGKKLVKQVIVRIEHVRPSNCQKEVIERNKYREEHGVAPPKRMPGGPREAFTVSLKNNTPEDLKQTINYSIF